MASSSCSYNTREMKYDVFLSFRGEDTRYTFTSHLYAALCRRKIETFIDNELQKGDEISPALLETIESSGLSIIILSKNYASSTWCLNELLKILECKKTKGQIVLPIFYHVLPTEVRKQTGSYAKAFAEHEKNLKNTKDKVSSWRAALSLVANMSGWDIKQHDRPESEIIEEIVKDVSRKLQHLSSGDHSDGLVGISSLLEKVISSLCIGTVDILIMGIWGMPGIGKTTLARAMFNGIANQFESCCFLENIREELAKCSLNNLQEKLLSELLWEPNLQLNVFSAKRMVSRKKVFLVLDDVNSAQHLKYLVGDHNQFGPGSRIIITSRDKQVLKNSIDKLFEVKELNYFNSLQLFSLNAFKQGYPNEEYMGLSNFFVYYANGNPLAFKVLGCLLFGKSKPEWKSLLKKLKSCPNVEIQNVLKISYDGLDYQEKKIFLDIACFFKGENRSYVIAILNGNDLSAEIGISTLIDKGLITVVQNKLLMHDLIQEMGRDIVFQESIKDPGKRSRLWNSQDIYNLFKKNEGSSAVECISLDLSHMNELHLSSDAFTRMHGISYLKFYSSDYSKGKSTLSRFYGGNLSALSSCYGGDQDVDKVHLRQGLEELPDDLRYLHWHGYPLKSLPSKFNPGNLVVLQMPHSNVKHLWKGNHNLKNLRDIDLTHSEHLTEVPNLSQASNLEILELDGCSKLTKFPVISRNIKELNLGHTAIEEVPWEIGCLNQLLFLKMMHCTRLKNLPSSLSNLTSLRELHLGGCSSITEFPELSGDVNYLDLAKTAIEEVPSSIERLIKLDFLSLAECGRLKRVSSIIFKLKSLTTVFFSSCSDLVELPEVLETNENLECLYLDRSAIIRLPASIELLHQLSKLNTGVCENLESFPNSICNMKNLSFLNLTGFSAAEKMLEDLPLSASSGLCSVKSLSLRRCNLSKLPTSLSCLTSLEDLNLSLNNFESLSLRPFSSLQELDISQCYRLQFLEAFPVPSRLRKLQAHECISLARLPPAILVYVDHNFDHRFVFSNCLSLGAIGLSFIMREAPLRIEIVAIQQRGTVTTDTFTRVAATMEDPLEEGVELIEEISFRYPRTPTSVSYFFPGNEIPGWFSVQSSGSSLKVNLPQGWCNDNYLGFVFCVVASFEDYKNTGFRLHYKGYFLTDNDDDEHYLVTAYSSYVDFGGNPGFLNSDHVFLEYHRMFPAIVQGADEEHNLSIYSSCHRACFIFDPRDKFRKPIPNCKIEKCGVYLLHLGEENAQRSGDDNLHEEEIVETGGEGISNVEDQEDPNSTTLEETENNSESVVDSLLLPEGGVKMIFKKVLSCLFSCGGD